MRLAIPILIFGVAISGASVARAASKRAEEILNSIDDMYRGESSHGKLTMKVQTENWSRELSVEFWGRAPR